MPVFLAPLSLAVPNSDEHRRCELRPDAHSLGDSAEPTPMYLNSRYDARGRQLRTFPNDIPDDALVVVVARNMLTMIPDLSNVAGLQELDLQQN